MCSSDLGMAFLASDQDIFFHGRIALGESTGVGRVGKGRGVFGFKVSVLLGGGGGDT